MLATDARSVADLSLPSSDPGADTLPKVRSLAPRSLPRFAGLFFNCTVVMAACRSPPARRLRPVGHRRSPVRAIALHFALRPAIRRWPSPGVPWGAADLSPSSRSLAPGHPVRPRFWPPFHRGSACCPDSAPSRRFHSGLDHRHADEETEL